MGVLGIAIGIAIGTAGGDSEVVDAGDEEKNVGHRIRPIICARVTPERS